MSYANPLTFIPFADALTKSKHPIPTTIPPLKNPNGVSAQSPTLFVETAPAPRTMLGFQPQNIQPQRGCGYYYTTALFKPHAA